MELVQNTTIAILLICMLLSFSKRRRYAHIDTYSDPYSDPYSYSLFLIVVFVVVLIFVEGLRHGYEDTANYKGTYNKSIDGDLETLLRSSKEPGFVLIQWLLKRLSSEPQFFILVVAAFLNTADVWFIKKYSTDLSFSLYLYFLLAFLANMNGIRQLTAATFMMLAFRWVVEKKYVRYVLLVALLSTIHRSILVVIPLILVFGGRRWNIFAILFLLFCLFSAVVPGPINALIGALAEDDYAGYITGYTANASIINVFIEAVPLILGLFYHVNNMGGNKNNSRAIDILINMQIVRFGFMLLATGMAQYARIGMYMKNVTALLVPFLIDRVFGGKDKQIVKLAAIGLYFIVFVVQNRLLNARGSFDVLYLDFSMFS